VLLKYLRLSPPRPTTPSSSRLKPHRRSSIISLGKAIVALYLITLLAAVISARTLAENGLDQPVQREIDSQKTAPQVAGG
jgi:hypothetical protein